MHAPLVSVSRAAARLLAVGLAGSACAADGERRVWLQLGAFHPNVDSSVQITDPAGGVSGTVLSLESDLDLKKSKTLGWVLAGARLGERWRAEFEVFWLRRSGSRRLSSDIVVVDTTYPASVVVHSKFESRIYRLGLGNSLPRTPQWEAGMTLGFTIVLDGQGSLDGGTVTRRREQRDETLPLPTIGAYASVALTPRWHAAGRVSLFSMKARGFDGRLVDLQASVVYRVDPNVGVGIGYRYDDDRLASARSRYNGRLEYKFRGPQAFVEATI